MVSDFQTLDAGVALLDFEFEGAPLRAPQGSTVAAALLCAGVKAFRVTPVSGALRGPFCLMGACFDCLVEIDGEPNQQACMTELRAGMRIMRMCLDTADD